jgi:hypothetical protein
VNIRRHIYNQERGRNRGGGARGFRPRKVNVFNLHITRGPAALASPLICPSRMPPPRGNKNVYACAPVYINKNCCRWFWGTKKYYNTERARDMRGERVNWLSASFACNKTPSSQLLYRRETPAFLLLSLKGQFDTNAVFCLHFK